MGLNGIARVLSFLRTERNGAKLSDVTLDPGGGPNITGEHIADAGDDAYPLTTDYAATMSIPRDGGRVSVGYADPINTPKAEAGEKRIYGRDATTGQAVNEVWLKADGSVLTDNANGSVELKANGEIVSTNAGGSVSLKPDGTLSATAVNSMTFTAPVFNFVGNMIITGSLTLGGIFSAIAGSLAATGGMGMTGGDITADGKSVKTHTHAQGNDSNGDSEVETNAPT